MSLSLNKLFISLLIISAIFFSVFGEYKASLFEDLPRIPNTEHLNSRCFGVKMISGLLFGGFRGIIVDLSWIHLDNLWHHARFYKMPPIYEFITILQPDYIHVWVMGGWHMAYNMSLDIKNNKNISEDIKRKIALKWAYRGIKFLETGHYLNPDNAEIPFEIGWTYYHRLKEYEKSIKWFKICSEKEDSSYVTVRLIGFAYEKLNKLNKALLHWKSLRLHESYKDDVSRKIINKNIERLEKLVK